MPRRVLQQKEGVVVRFLADETYMLVTRKELHGTAVDVVHSGQEVTVTYDKVRKSTAAAIVLFIGDLQIAKLVVEQLSAQPAINIEKEMEIITQAENNPLELQAAASTIGAKKLPKRKRKQGEVESSARTARRLTDLDLDEAITVGTDELGVEMHHGEPAPIVNDEDARDCDEFEALFSGAINEADNPRNSAAYNACTSKHVDAGSHPSNNYVSANFGSTPRTQVTAARRYDWDATSNTSNVSPQIRLPTIKRQTSSFVQTDTLAVNKGNQHIQHFLLFISLWTVV